jgi:hypothetical protein
MVAAKEIGRGTVGNPPVTIPPVFRRRRIEYARSRPRRLPAWAKIFTALCIAAAIGYACYAAYHWIAAAQGTPKSAEISK